MTPEYVQAKKRIKKLTRRIEKAAGLQHLGIKIKHHYVEDYKDGGEDNHYTVAESEMYWQYRHGTIRWFLPAVCRLDDERLRVSAIHEYVHVVMNPMETHVKEKYTEHCEFAVESMAMVLDRMFVASLR